MTIKKALITLTMINMMIVISITINVREKRESDRSDKTIKEPSG